MFDIYTQLQRWTDDNAKNPIYLATITDIEGSAVRGAGATMGIAADDSLTGSVSGGCIESTVIETVKRLRAQNGASQIRFCPNDDPFGGPSPCGGTVQVCIYPYSASVGAAVASRLTRGQDILWGVCTVGPEDWLGTFFALDSQDELHIGLPASRSDSAEVKELLAKLLSHEFPNGFSKNYGVIEMSAKETQPEVRFFMQYHPPVPHAVIVGGSHIGEALVHQLKALGWRISVVDPRETFAAPERFSAADVLLHKWPQEAFEELGISGRSTYAHTPPHADYPARHTAVAAITHSEQIDDAAVGEALGSNCFYVGVLGSRKTLQNRLQRLRAEGYTEDQLSRIHGPIGLDIGALNPEEIALAITAEMVQDYRKGNEGHGHFKSRA
ncbi:MAG TPA: XdhC family protein [Clostridia bacterium]|nr:XdhC family protein [Clostridia bacterium]